MAKFSLDFDGIEFDTDDNLTWNLALDDNNSFGKNPFDQIHENGIDQNIMFDAAGDPLQGWLHQQVITPNEDVATTTFEPTQSTMILGQSSQFANSIGQSSFNHIPRHDSSTSMQSMTSAASSSSRRGQRIVGAYPCGQCDRVFDVPSDLRHHERNHMANESRPYACHHCGQRFLYPKDRTRHILRKHDLAGAPPSGSLSRTQSLNDVSMSPVDESGPIVNIGDFQPMVGSGYSVDMQSNPVNKCRCGIDTRDGNATSPLEEEAVRFSESAIERLQIRLEHVHKDLMSARTQRIEVAEMHARASNAISVIQDEQQHSDAEGTGEGTVDAASCNTISGLQYLLAQQEVQINRLKTEVQFATRDAAFWLDECNHYAWLLRTIPNAPRPPIYAIPEQNGRVSLVQYAKSWLGAIRMMFSSANMEAKKIDVGPHLVDRLVHELDHLFVQE